MGYLRESSSPPCDWKSFWRDFSEVWGGSGGSLRKGAQTSKKLPWCGNFHTEVCLGTPQTSKKSLQKRFHGEAGPSTVLLSQR